MEKFPVSTFFTLFYLSEFLTDNRHKRFSTLVQFHENNAKNSFFKQCDAMLGWNLLVHQVRTMVTPTLD